MSFGAASGIPQAIVNAVAAMKFLDRDLFKVQPFNDRATS